MITSDADDSMKNVNVLNLGQNMIHLENGEMISVDPTEAEDLIESLRLIRKYYTNIASDLHHCTEDIDDIETNAEELIMSLDQFYNIDSELRTAMYVNRTCLFYSFRLNFFFSKYL